MKNIYTFVAVAVLLALGLYVYLFERSPIDPNAVQTLGASASPPPVVLLSLKQPELLKLELDQNAPSRSTVLEQKNGKWLVDGKPADPARIDALLGMFEHWQASSLLEPAFNQATASDFGLNPPELILRLELSGGKSQSFKIGTKTPTSSGNYLLKEGDPALYLAYINVPEELLRLLSEPPVAKSESKADAKNDPKTAPGATKQKK